MCEESIIGTNLSRKATLLMAEVLHMANKVLSSSAAAKIQVWKPPRVILLRIALTLPFQLSAPHP